MSTILNVFLTAIAFFIVNTGLSQQQNCYINADKQLFYHYIDSCINEVIIDVRTAKEFKHNPLPEAINAPTVKNLLSIIDTMDIDTPVLIYCDQGTRSIKACEIVCKKGFKIIVNLTEGIKTYNKITIKE
jgi:rhodanese-related sulfurtransferase